MYCYIICPSGSLTIYMQCSCFSMTIITLIIKCYQVFAMEIIFMEMEYYMKIPSIFTSSLITILISIVYFQKSNHQTDNYYLPPKIGKSVIHFCIFLRITIFGVTRFLPGAPEVSVLVVHNHSYRAQSIKREIVLEQLYQYTIETVY